MNRVHVIDAEGQVVGPGAVVSIGTAERQAPAAALVVKLASYRLPFPAAIAGEELNSGKYDWRDLQLATAAVQSLREENADLTGKLAAMEAQRDRIAAQYGRLQELVRTAAALDAEAEPW